MQKQELKLRAGRYRIPVTLIYDDSRIYFKFKFNRPLMAEVKSMQSPRWHGYDDTNPRKIWSVANSPRNHFQIQYLAGLNPYKNYEQELLPCNSSRDLMSHQVEMIKTGLTYHYMIWACEMGTGKTLAAIEVMEQAGLTNDQVWYIGPKAGVKAVNLELIKWDAKVRPCEMLTYEGLVKKLKNWDGSSPPKMVILDESSKVKTEKSQRSQAALHLANAIREEHGDEGYVIEMTGTPAPKSPVDWWMLCEIACPGFLKEGAPGALKMRCALVEEREAMSGGMYPHLVTWLDDDTKCGTCGQHHTGLESHEFVPSINEVAYLFERMSPLVLVKFKKDCLDIPEKRYEIIKVKPTPETLRAAKLIRTTASRAVSALILLRELSDGFQYVETPDGKMECPLCNGLMVIDIPEPDTPCPHCGAKGEVTRYKRTTDVVGSPKDEIFIEQLDLHEDVGRFIVWGGFTGTIDRLVDMAHQQGWHVLRIDGRGYQATDPEGAILDDDEFLVAMDRSHKRFKEFRETYDRICVVGHPQAGGMALTLTASPTELYYSNSFNGEARSQSEDRFHRRGMDENRGGLILDIIHLKADQVVLDNLKLKRKLETMSMGQLQEALDATE